MKQSYNSSCDGPGIVVHWNEGGESWDTLGANGRGDEWDALGQRLDYLSFHAGAEAQRSYDHPGGIVGSCEFLVADLPDQLNSP